MRRGTAAVVAGAAMLALLSGPGCRWDVVDKGAAFGLNWAKLKDGGAKTDSRFGIAGGHFMTYDVKESMAYQSEILFSMKGGKELERKGAGPPPKPLVETTSKVSYIEYHGLAKFTRPSRGTVKPVLLAGGSFGFKIGDELVVDGVPGDLDAKSFELGLIVGGGAEFEVSGKMLRVDLRYGIGITDVTDAGQQKNRVTTLMVSFVF